MKKLIATPNKREMCGMYQLAKDLATEINADITTIQNPLQISSYDEIITFLYPMHKLGKKAKKLGKKWIVYDMGVPQPEKKYFPNFFRRQYMKLFYRLNEQSKKGADEYWELSERKLKPNWTERIEAPSVFRGYNNIHFRNLKQNDSRNYALYVGRKTDYKNFEWLANIMDYLKIPFVTPPDNCSNELVHQYYSGAKIFVTASLWEGYGRPVMEAEALGIPAIAYDVGTHKKNIRKGICVPLGDEEFFKDSIRDIWDQTGGT